MEDSLLPSVYFYPNSSIGPQNVVATQGSNSASQLFTVTSLTPVIILDPTSGPVGTPVDITGAGFTPSSDVTVTFAGAPVATVTTTPIGTFDTNFNVPLSSSIGDQTVKATQGSNSASKTFTVTPLLGPVVLLDPTSGPVDTPVDITGAGFAPSSAVAVTFAGAPVATVTTSPTGTFDTNFNVPLSSSIGDQTVKATQGSNSASKTFTVGSTSLAATSRSSFELPMDQSNATLALLPSNQSNGSVPKVTNSTFDNAESKGTIIK